MRRYAFIASFATGFAVMAGELGLGRLLAPFFGSSTPVWAFIIGTVMGSLSLGYLVGGRLAARPSRRSTLPLLVAASGVTLLALPWLLVPLLRGALAFFLRGAMGHLFTLAACAAPLFAIPFFLLGATSPLILQAVAGDSRQVGRAGAWLYAASTWGGLLGTFVPVLLLVPLVGSRATFTLCGLTLLLIAVLGLRHHGRAASALGATSFVVAALPYMLAAGAPAPGMLYEAESAYHSLRVEDDGSVRRLSFDEGYATQSVRLAGGALPLTDVWGYYALAPAWSVSGRPRDVLILGLGGGTSASLYAALYPEAHVCGVEIDAAVVAAGRRFFDLPAATEVAVEDARTFITRDTRAYDVILVDAFHFPYIPFQLTTLEFFESLALRLRPGGVIVLNVGRDGNDRDIVHAIAATATRVFPHVLGVDVANRSNTILVAMRHSPGEMVGLVGLRLPPAATMALGALRSAAPWRVPAGTEILTDDQAPIEWMTDRIVLRRLLRALGGGAS